MNNEWFFAHLEGIIEFRINQYIFKLAIQFNQAPQTQTDMENKSQILDLQFNQAPQTQRTNTSENNRYVGKIYLKKKTFQFNKLTPYNEKQMNTFITAYGKKFNSILLIAPTIKLYDYPANKTHQLFLTHKI